MSYLIHKYILEKEKITMDNNAKQPTRIKERTKEIQRNERSLGDFKERNMAECPHCNTESGDITLFPAQKQDGPGRKYICKQCQKEVNIQSIPVETLRQAIAVLDDACDVIKMKTVWNKDEDAKMGIKISKFQYRLRTLIERAYTTAVSKNTNDRRGNNGGRQNQSGGFQRPTTTRR